MNIRDKVRVKVGELGVGGWGSHVSCLFWDECEKYNEPVRSKAEQHLVQELLPIAASTPNGKLRPVRQGQHPSFVKRYLDNVRHKDTQAKIRQDKANRKIQHTQDTTPPTTNTTKRQRHKKCDKR